MDLNRGSLVLEAISLLTAPQPLPKSKRFWSVERRRERSKRKRRKDRERVTEKLLSKIVSVLDTKYLPWQNQTLFVHGNY